MTITTSTDYADITYSEILGEEFLDEARPNNVVSRLVNEYDIEGLPTGTLKLNRWNSPGRAGSASEGVPFNTLTTLGTTPITVSPTEFAVFQTLVTNDAVENRVPGMRSVAELMSAGSTAQKLAALRHEARIGAKSLFETHEFKCAELLSGFSTTSGPASGAALLVDHIEDAYYNLSTAESLPHEDIVIAGSATQEADLRTDLRGETATPFTRDLATILQIMPDISRTGLKGMILGLPFYRYGIEVAPTANLGVDHVGGMFLKGSGAPELNGSGAAGALAFVQGRRITTTVAYEQRERAGELQLNWKGQHIERQDAWGVGLISRATR